MIFRTPLLARGRDRLETKCTTSDITRNLANPLLARGRDRLETPFIVSAELTVPVPLLARGRERLET